ncbi:DUF2842 domain-containing protein [Pseudochelatococcus lubricantis]|uniref:DUF2842 domain-containing protein n=1 Tax=Pseudochelatococcus lubricantis TaxID=1538102 RepID=UPI0035F02768
MKRRTRKFIGTIAILAFGIFYALLVMAFAHSRVPEWPSAAQLAFYIVFGMGWILPILPLIRWMEKRGAGEE